MERAAVKNDRRRLIIAIRKKSRDDAQVMDDLLENTGINPSTSLLIDGGPGRKIVRQEAPWTAGLNDVPQSVEEFAQRMLPLRRISRIRVR